jgi:hypothetical protein
MGQSLEELEGREAKHLATVPIGLGEPIDQTSLWGAERLNAGRGVKPLQGERPAKHSSERVARDPLGPRPRCGPMRRRKTHPFPAMCACPPRWRRPEGHAGRTTAPGLASRNVDLSARRKMPSTPLATSGVWCRNGRSRLGTDSTHCRTGRCGNTSSVRWAATSAMRRALHEGQTPRPLQEKARSRSCPQSVQRTRA